MVGAAEWTPKIRCFNTISDAIRQNTEIPLISPSDEAFAVLVVANCIDRWTQSQEDDEDDTARAQDETKPKKAPVNGRYTRVDAGQVKYGGWTKEGLIHYNELLKLNRDARASPRCAVVEEKCMQMLRKKHKITGNNWQEHANRKKRKKGYVEEPVQDGPEEEVLADVEMIMSDTEEP